MKVNRLRIIGWALVVASIAVQPYGWMVAFAMMLAFCGGHFLGYASGKLDARDQLREEFRKGSKLL